jgi:hypothetical protein
MPRRRTPTDDEIKTISETFRALWKHDEPIVFFLRRNANHIRELVDEESWATAARVFTHMGLIYKTGKPWTADSFSKLFYSSTAPRKKQSAGTALPLPAAPAAGVGAAPPSAFAQNLPPAIAPHQAGGAVAPTPPARGDDIAATKIQPPVPVVASPAVQPVPDQRFKPASLKPYEPPPQPTPEELVRIEKMYLKVFGTTKPKGIT